MQKAIQTNNNFSSFSPKQPNSSLWIKAVAIIKFDIDQGQRVDKIVPDLGLSTQAEKQIAMLAFPDSNSLGQYEGTFKYIFKLKNDCFGYTCFKQKKDPQNPRGYSQKSLVILSYLPFPTFFLKMAQFLVFKTFHKFDDIQQNLIKFVLQAQQWPDPVPLNQYTLPVLQYELKVQIPNYAVNNKNIQSNDIKIQIDKSRQFSIQQIVSKEALKRAGRFQQIKITQITNSGTQMLWNLWQSVILNKKILIMGNNPYQVSQAVLGSISLINPFHFFGQYSPYVTVFDSNLQRYQNQSENFIIGGTNPLFNKLFNSKEIIICDLKQNKIQQNNKQKYTPIPVKQIVYDSKCEEQKAINQSTLRKYFFRLNKSIITQIQQYINCQKNDMKFFNASQFLFFIKSKKNLQHLQELYEKKKYLLAFFEKFIKTPNFRYFLRSRNIHISTTSTV